MALRIQGASTRTMQTWATAAQGTASSATLASYTYDANGNRATMVTSAGTTTYTYDSADVMLKTKKDPTGKVTNYTYDTNGNLTKAVYDPTGANQTTTYTYDSNNRLTEVDEPSGTKVQFAYDADGNRISKTVINGSTTTVVKDVYALGHLAYQTDGTGNILATFTYATNGTPTSVTLGSGTGAPRYYYVYNGHGDVVAMTDSNGAVVASYAYDAFGVLAPGSSENFPNGWSNPYRYDGAEGVRYDPETSLYWMSVRAYDPTLGRFISHDPLGRLAGKGLDFHPYVYTGNNPLIKTDPSGMMPEYIGSGGGSGVTLIAGTLAAIAAGISRAISISGSYYGLLRAIAHHGSSSMSLGSASVIPYKRCCDENPHSSSSNGPANPCKGTVNEAYCFGGHSDYSWINEIWKNHASSMIAVGADGESILKADMMNLAGYMALRISGEAAIHQDWATGLGTVSFTGTELLAFISGIVYSTAAAQEQADENSELLSVDAMFSRFQTKLELYFEGKGPLKGDPNAVAILSEDDNVGPVQHSMCDGDPLAYIFGCSSSSQVYTTDERLSANFDLYIDS